MIALSWNPTAAGADIALTPAGAIAGDDGLTSCVILSLFLDARARPDDELPDSAGGDRRGWLGDAFAATDRIGSRLWLLTRAKQTEETRRRAEDYAAEALAWLVEDGLATSVSVTAEWVAMGLLGLRCTIATAGDAVQQTFTIRF
jgi:phage gp46-like protein